MTRARWMAVAAAGLVAVLFSACFGFGPYVRHVAAQKATSRGASIAIGSVRPAMGGVILRDVSVSLADVPALSIVLQEVRLEGSPWSGVSSVRVQGGEIVARGEIDELLRGLRASLLRGRGPDSAGSRPLSVQLEKLDVHWTSAGDSVNAHDLSVQKTVAGWEIAVGRAELAHRGTDAAIQSLRVGLQHAGAEWKVSSLRAGVLDAHHHSAVKDGSTPVSPGSETGEATSKLLARAEELKRLSARGVALVLSLLSPGATVRIDELRLEVRHEDEVLHLGPDSLSLSASGPSIDLSLTPAARAGDGTPLLLAAALPSSLTEPLSMTVQGGPVTIAALGVHEGDLGLLDVDKTMVEAGGKVVLSGDARHVELELHGRVRGLSVENKKLASEPVRGLEVGFALAGGAELDGSQLRVDRGDIDIGTVHAEVKGEVARSAEGTSLRGTFAIPLAACQGLVDALPPGLAPALLGVRVGGTFAFRGQVTFDSRHAADAVVDVTLMNECRVTSAPPAVNVARFRAPFHRKVYTPEGQRVDIESGPGTPGWVPYGGISRFMEAAVLTTEDGGFRRHRGFDVEAIRNSIRENLKAGRFVRGASTISMQTAKNVYLEREKTLARKLQEAFLTSYLEQELSKEQILELYLNSIEFGPMVYGIGPAAAHYFHTSAAELSLGQALYLSSILPNPKVQHFGEGGRVSASWMSYLHKLMRLMVKHHLIDEADLAEGLGEWVVFGQPKPMRARGDDVNAVEGAPPDDVAP